MPPKKDRDITMAVDARVNAAIEERLTLFEVLSFQARMEAAIAQGAELMEIKQLNGKKLADFTREDCLWQASVLSKAGDRLEKIKTENGPIGGPLRLP